MNYIDGDIIKQITTSELNNLSGITSKIQTQLNDKLNKTTNSLLNNLVVFDTENNIKDDGIKITNDNELNLVSEKLIPSSLSIKNYVDNKINNLQQSTAIGQPIQLFFGDSMSEITDYENLLFKPDNSNQVDEIITLTSTNNRVLLHSYITHIDGLQRNRINAGIFSASIYCYINDIASITKFELELCVRKTTGTETKFLDMISGDINNTNIQLININSTLVNDFNIDITDRLVIKVFGYTTINDITKTIQLHFIHSGVNYNSFINTPFILKHNDLEKLDDLNENYHHLSLEQKTILTRESSITQNGILSVIDYNKFNNKQDNITGTTNLTLNNLTFNGTINNITASKFNLLFQPHVLQITIKQKIFMVYNEWIFRRDLYSNPNNQSLTSDYYDFKGQTNILFHHNFKTPIAYTNGFYQINITITLREPNYICLNPYVGNPSITTDNKLNISVDSTSNIFGFELFDFYDGLSNLRRSYTFSNIIYLKQDQTINFKNDVVEQIGLYELNKFLFTMYLVSPQ